MNLDTTYEIAIKTADIWGNVNESSVQDTAKTLGYVADISPPSSVTDLQNTTYTPNYINWSWINPSDTDFSHVMVYLNGIFQRNITAPANFYNTTDVNPDTEYIISTHTADTSGNVNDTWVNDTASTLIDLQILDLLPENGSRLGSNTVQFSWRTSFNGTTDVYIKSQDETNYTRYVGDNDTFHSVLIDNLTRNKWYYYYVSSGSATSEYRSFYIDNGIEFSQKSYNFTIERDYSQLVSVSVRNMDSNPHSLLVSTYNPYNDLIFGFIGNGSQDQEIELNPGESKNIILSIFAQDAVLSNYRFQITLNSTDSSIYDYAVVNLKVRQPNIDYTVTEIDADPYTLAKTFQVTNNGDRITDFSIFAEGELANNTLFKPAISHANIGSGESLTFKLVPLLEPVTSTASTIKANSVASIIGSIKTIGAGESKTVSVDFSQSGGKTLYNSVLSDVTICMGTNSWYCTNRPNIENMLYLPPGFDSSDVKAAVLAVSFSLPWNENNYRNHNVDISINGHHVKSLIDTIPNGVYLIPIDPSYLNYGSIFTGVNKIEINTEHLNGGHYVVATNIELRLKLISMRTWLFADSQEQADTIAKSMDFLCDKCVPKTEIFSIEASPASGQLTVAPNQNVIFNVSVKLKNTESGVLQVEVYKGNSLITKSFKDVAGSPDSLENFTLSFQAPDAAGAYDYKVLVRFREGMSGELISDDFCEVRHQITYNINVEKITIRKRIGLQAGHWQYDSGAIGCDGQTREVDINLEVANKAAEILRQRGYTVEVLPSANAPNSPIPGYTADVFVALHTDYCAGENSGFKVSRYGGAKGTGKLGNGDASDRLVDSLWLAYGADTGLPQDISPGHFTDDMIYYNALNLIGKSVPGAIIEMGWLSGDFAFMTSVEGQQKMATGIANSVDQFLNQALNPPTELTQFKSDEKTQINVGEIADRSKVVFSAKVNDPDGDKVKLQVELRRLDEYDGNFDETKGGFKESDPVASGSTVTTYAIDLIDGSYHWRARTIDEHGNKSEWVSFGGNSDSSADFIVQGFRFVQLTDIHIGPDPDCFNYKKYPENKDDDSKRNNCLSNSHIESYKVFKNATESIIKLDPKPDFVLITGDLVEWNQINQYEFLTQLIKKFGNILVYTVPGNHDRRGLEDPADVHLLRIAYPQLYLLDLPLDLLGTVLPQNDLINYFDFLANNDKTNEIFDRNGYRFIGIDSGSDPFWDIYSGLIIQEPTGSGLSPQQIDIIRNNAIYGKTFIFMHHPDIDDDNSLNVISKNRQQFINLMKDKKVKLVLTGHTHVSKLYYNSCTDCGILVNGQDIEINKIIPYNYDPFYSLSPLFVQTRSATKDKYDDAGFLVAPKGYLIVDVGKDINDINKIQLQDVKMLGAKSEPVATITIFSPADIHVYDVFGRHTGLNASGGIDTNIPDTYYLKESKMGNITLPASVLLYNNTLNYSFEVVSNFSKENVTGEQSSFNFTIEQRTGDTIKTINYNNVSINRNSIAYLKLNITQTNYAMQVDLNNDSIMDVTKVPDTIITDHAPTVTILSPTNGSTRDQGQPITFNGTAIDLEDGILTKLTWISDRDDVIGHGNFTTSNLSAGIHQITLLANDTAGQVNTSNIVLTVIDTKAPVVDIEYPPINKIFNKENITVRGIAYDDSGISNVTVNGLQAGKEDWNTVLTLNEGENRIYVVATDNYGFTTTTNRTVYYNSSLASDIQPPAAITNLTDRTGYDSVNGAWINWTWDNPKDQDFSYAIVYLDNIPMGNTLRSYFNFTGLSSDADYNISILTADIVDNINYSEVKDTARTPLPDTAQPQSITNPILQAAGPTYLNFTWLNPPDPDFSHVMLYLNGSFKTSIPAPQNYYNFTGLDPDTLYELGTHTVDSSGNVNETWVNATGRTLSTGAVPQVADCGADKLGCENVGAKVQFNGSASYDPDGTISSYYWEFGDGATETDVVPNHTYAAYRWNGSAYQPFIVNITVTDNDGLQNSTSQNVTIWIAGDANGDGKVNILDASVVGLKWNGNDACADLNNDGKVNILDASIIGLNWGKFTIIGG